MKGQTPARSTSRRYKEGEGSGNPRDDIRTYGPGYVYLCRKVRNVLGIDLAGYKGQQMHRRLDGLRIKLEMGDFYTFARALERDSAVASEVLDLITINVSEFFRNPGQWAILRDKILPKLCARTCGTLRAWSAGSSAGQEAYSLATCLDLMLPGRFGVLATDIDLLCLHKGQEGLYSKQEVEGVPGHILAQYFRQEGQSFRVNNRLRRSVTFRRHDLLCDTYPSGFHLILCRNVLIYFTGAGRDTVVRNLVGAMTEGGVIFTGSTEALFGPQDYGLTQIHPFFYRKTTR